MNAFGLSIRKSLLETPVVNWIKTIQASGGSAPSFQTISAVNTFHRQLRNTSFYSKMKSVNCFVPDNLTACLVPLISTLGNSAWTNFNFVSGDLTTGGLLGNGSSKYLNTGVVPWSETSFGLSMCVPSAINESKYTAGAGETVMDYNKLVSWYWSFGGTTYFDCYSQTGGRISAANSAFNGYMSANRIANNDQKVYKANSGTSHTQIASGTNTSYGTRPTGPVLVYAQGAGTAVYNNLYSGQKISFMALHDGLTAAESSIFFNLIQILRKQINGGWV